MTIAYDLPEWVLDELSNAREIELIRWAAARHADAFGPILDPTFYREKAGAMEEDRRMLEAALRFVNAEVRRG